MTFVLRAARASDLPVVYEMAKSTGGGFTNLPPDEPRLKAKLDAAASAFERADDTLDDDMFFFVLEDFETGTACGTCQIFSQIGLKWPFYSYKLSSFAKYSRELDRTFNAQMLTLSTEYNGCTEVGGLFLHPDYRSAGVGSLLARTRYLFIRSHRARFADRTVAELRGVIDDTGTSPFWDALGGRFFGMSFHEADQYNGVNGNQFIADFAPKHPIYTSLLPETAMKVMGLPHATGRAAMRMLEKEGFHFDDFIDIFDGGPTMAVATDEIGTLRAAREDVVVALSAVAPTGSQQIVTYGRLAEFRATYGVVEAIDGGISLDAAAASAIGAMVGDRITYVPK